MKTLVFILGILSILYAIPYGTWEFNNENKIGGFIIYLFCLACLVATITNFFFI